MYTKLVWKGGLLCSVGSTYAKNSHTIINLVCICICNPFTRNWQNIVDVSSIIKPIYDVKALTFDEASKNFKIFNLLMRILKKI
jgi:hypothetical protein